MKTVIGTFGFAFFLLISFSQVAFGATIYMSPSGSNYPCGNATNPCVSFYDAIQASENGDIVNVRKQIASLSSFIYFQKKQVTAGTYTAGINGGLTSMNSLTFLGFGDVTVDVAPTTRFLELSGFNGNVTFQGITFQGADFPGSGGVMLLSNCAGSISFENCAFQNSDTLGGAVGFLTNTTASFSSCVFSGNQALDGGALDINGGSNVMITESNFTNNIIFSISFFNFLSKKTKEEFHFL